MTIQYFVLTGVVALMLAACADTADRTTAGTTGDTATTGDATTQGTGDGETTGTADGETTGTTDGETTGTLAASPHAVPSAAMWVQASVRL